MTAVLSSVILMISALLPLVNPLGSAPIFLAMTPDASRSQRKALSGQVGVPANTLIVHGQFTAVNEGNKSMRVMIGFGAGDVQAGVRVSLMTETQPIMLSEFKLKSQSGKKPGAAATMGVGTAATAAAGAATGSIGDKKATVEGDVSRMAKAVAKQIADLMIAEKWISPPQPESK